jgi:hypothetical protein
VAISTGLLELSILFISAAAGSDLLGLEEEEEEEEGDGDDIGYC